MKEEIVGGGEMRCLPKALVGSHLLYKILTCVCDLLQVIVGFFLGRNLSR